MDFSLKKYKTLLISLQTAGYDFITFAEFCEGKRAGKFVILRHDIDKLPENALKFAEIEHKLSIKASYFFLTKKSVFKENIIRKIHNFGHEIGYHYKDFVDANGNFEKAINLFRQNLSLLRAVVPLKTIAMDGCPTSRYDNRDLWKNYHYRDFGIIGEPYFDIDFDKVFYLTDTGRSWDGDKYSVRDKVRSAFTQKFHTTDQIIEAAKNNTLPAHLMITAHPQRWTNNAAAWVWEYVWQSVKNQIKFFLNKK